MTIGPDSAGRLRRGILILRGLALIGLPLLFAGGKAIDAADGGRAKHGRASGLAWLANGENDDAHWWGGFGTDSLRGLDDEVQALAVYDSSIIAGGLFFTTGGRRVNQIARWDGTAWHTLGSGVQSLDCPGIACYPKVYALAVYNGDLIAGGIFGGAGGIPANYIARWDGTSWFALGSGLDAAVVALTVYDGSLIVGGEFTVAGGQVANHIARWDGYSWHPLGPGTDYAVLALEVYRGDLIAAGSFTEAGGTRASGVARWDGISWRAMGGGLEPDVDGLLEFNGDLLAGGDFFSGAPWPPDSTSILFNGLARWDGTDWHRFEPEYTGRFGPRAIAIYNGSLVAGLGVTVSRWDGTSWNSLGSPLDDIVRALAVYNGSLYVGGFFTIAGGRPSWHIARWDDVITPVEVENLEAIANEGVVELSWRLSPDARRMLRQVEVERSDTPAGPYMDLPNSELLPRQEMVFKDQAVEVGRDYWYRLLLTFEGHTEFSNPVAVTVRRGSISRIWLSPIVDSSEQASILIRYGVGLPSVRLQLEVYDVAGHLVRSLYRGALGTGEYSTRWDRHDMMGGRVTRGVYVVRLNTKNVAISRKLVLLHGAP